MTHHLNEHHQNNHTFKLLIVGDSQVGKTSFINRHVTGDFSDEYTPTLKIDVKSLFFNTTDGQVCFNVWDCFSDDHNYRGSPEEQYNALMQGYDPKGDNHYGLKEQQYDAAIIMFDLTNKLSFENCHIWYKQLQNDVPIIMLLGNKMDKSIGEVKSWEIREFMNLYPSMIFHYTSAKSNYNHTTPFKKIAEILLNYNELNYNELKFVAIPASTKKTFQIIDAIEENYPLPDPITIEVISNVTTKPTPTRKGYFSWLKFW